MLRDGADIPPDKFAADVHAAGRGHAVWWGHGRAAVDVTACPGPDPGTVVFSVRPKRRRRGSSFVWQPGDDAGDLGYAPPLAHWLNAAARLIAGADEPPEP